MKRIIAMLLVIGFALWIMPKAEALTSVPVSATATVNPELTLTMGLSRVDSSLPVTSPSAWQTVTSMAFGTLTHTLADGTEAGKLFSTPYYYVAFLGGFSSGRKYQIKSSCSGLVSGTTTVTDGFGLTFIDGNPKKSDGSPINLESMPADAILGSPGPAAVINKTIYDSGLTGASRTVAAYFGIPPPPAAGAPEPYVGYKGISTNTPAGNYTGTVTFTIVLY